MYNPAFFIGIVLICSDGYLLGIEQEEDHWIRACQSSNMVSTHIDTHDENIVNNDKLLQKCIESEKNSKFEKYPLPPFFFCLFYYRMLKYPT